ncbi:hypothetical protein [Streptomyces sp. NBC_01235]|uniref:hypothetical protein n=1 Tax=Streptomyces sp. NBC_01235 TaxID=2903788 RepID=UPI002E15C60B|nr:hypothetical protein OG289_41325 [Streptomyces sp. NBC_01235]
MPPHAEAQHESPPEITTTVDAALPRTAGGRRPRLPVVGRPGRSRSVGAAGAQRGVQPS